MVNENTFNENIINLYNELSNYTVPKDDYILLPLTEDTLDTIVICLGICKKQILWKGEKNDS